MKIGFNKKIITPTKPVELGGYGVERISTGVLDDIFVRTLVVEFNEEIYGIINYDLVAVDSFLIEEVKQEMKKSVLNIDNFIVSATHTHSSIGGTLKTSEEILNHNEDVFKKENKKIVSHIAKLTYESVLESIKNITDCNISISKGNIENVGKNRNNENFAGDNSILLVKISSDLGKDILLVNYACHPTILNKESTVISADLPGYLDTILQNKGYYYSMFLNGPSGDISTRFNRIFTGEKELNRIGEIFSNQVLKLLENMEEIKINYINSYKLNYKMKVKEQGNVDDARKKLDKYKERFEISRGKNIDKNALRLLESFVEGAEINLKISEKLSNIDGVNVSVKIIEINDEKFIIIPGEIFSELTNTIKDQNIHFITCTNGYLGYFANEFAYNNDFYEAMSSIFKSGEPEKLIEMIKRAIKN